MKHLATPRFSQCYNRLPIEIQKLADASYQQLQRDTRHPSLHFKKAAGYWSARVGLGHRALAIEAQENLLWVWIGTHAEYNQLLRRR